MQRKTLVILAACLVAVAATSILSWNMLQPQNPPKYEKNIARDFDSHEEEEALAAAESCNYSDISSLERFDNSKDPEGYLHPDTYISYTYANFVDSEVINYYQARYNNQQGKEGPRYPKAIEFTYEANVTMFPEFRIYNSPAPEGATWHNITIVKSTPNGSVQFSSGNMQFFYRNQSGYQMTQWEYDFNFTDCYVIEMKLLYSEYYAPLAAFWSDVYQIVVLDQNRVPLLFGVESANAVA